MRKYFIYLLTCSLLSGLYITSKAGWQWGLFAFLVNFLIPGALMLIAVLLEL